jgi:uncharacterized protein YbbC (DUF1343 family)
MKSTNTFLFFFLISFCCPGQAKEKNSQYFSPSRIIPADERMDLYLPLLMGKSVGIFANQTSMLERRHLVDTLLSRGIRIKKIFAPEHGFRGNADAGENINNLTDEKTGIQIVSLYGSRQKPTPEDLKDIDILLFDIQDVGTRFYTYISSLQKFLEAAMEIDKPLIILDRPNPNGFYIDGPVLDIKFKSFVGMQPVPVVYGMTIGEYAIMLLGEHWLSVRQYGKISRTEEKGPAFPNEKKQEQTIIEDGNDISTSTLALENYSGFYLKIICNKNYSHNSKYKLPVAPSPNLPNMQSVYLYPSLCFFEGTVISLGRGTTKPFQQFGSPLFPNNLYSFIPESMPGAKSPPLLNQTCYGMDLSTVDPLKETDNHLQLKWLFLAYRLFPDKTVFFLTTNYFNTLAGTDLLMQQIKDGVSENEIRKSWEPALRKFKEIREKYLLYP